MEAFADSSPGQEAEAQREQCGEATRKAAELPATLWTQKTKITVRDATASRA